MRQPDGQQRQGRQDDLDRRQHPDGDEDPDPGPELRQPGVDRPPRNEARHDGPDVAEEVGDTQQVAHDVVAVETEER